MVLTSSASAIALVTRKTTGPADRLSLPPLGSATPPTAPEASCKSAPRGRLSTAGGSEDAAGSLAGMGKRMIIPTATKATGAEGAAEGWEAPAGGVWMTTCGGALGATG